MSNNQIDEQQPLNEPEQLPEQLEETEETDPQIIPMFVFPSFKTEHYFTLCNNTIQKINYKNELVSDQRIGFPMRSNMGDRTRSAQLYSTINCNGHIYLQYFDKLIEVVENDQDQIQLFEMCLIPGIQKQDSWNSFHGKLFTVQNELFVVGGQNLYQYNDLNNKLIRIDQEIGRFYYSFYGQTVRWVPKTGIYKVNTDLTEELIIKTDEQFSCLSFCQNGVCVLHDSDHTCVLLIDLIQQKSYQLNEDVQKFMQASISQVLKVSKYGLTLDYQLLQSVFGIDFIVKRELLFKKYSSEQLMLNKNAQHSYLKQFDPQQFNSENEEEEEENELDQKQMVYNEFEQIESKVNENLLDQRIGRIEVQLNEMFSMMKQVLEQQKLILEAVGGKVAEKEKKKSE